MSNLDDRALYKFAPEVIKGWKSYPVRLRGPNQSKCHNADTLLVQSMEGGFVTANCAECGGKQPLTAREFFSLGHWISCPNCRARMEPQLLSTTPYARSTNYGYVCEGCRVYFLLANILPYWEDVA